MRRTSAAIALLLAALGAAPAAGAGPAHVGAAPAAGSGPAHLDEWTARLHVDSGPIVARRPSRGVVYSTRVKVPGAAWLRLRLDRTLLGAAPSGGRPTQLRLTALEDGAVQVLDAEQIREWQGTSAYFNGDLLLVEVVADPRAATSRVTLTHAWAGRERDGSALESICGLADNRELSDDPRLARTSPLGCTAFLIDDPNHCFLTAGHCAGGIDVVMFNVPLSEPDGDPRFPGPQDQYAVDPASIQASVPPVTGNDWTYFGCFANPVSGLTPFQAQGAFFALAEAAPPATSQPVSVTGYGTTDPPVPEEWNTAQKTHEGPYVELTGTTIRYQVDTTAGNSGSPVIDAATGEVIGIHTDGGCEFIANAGTAVHNPFLQDALASPRGVCNPCPAVIDCNGNGVDDACDLDGGASADCDGNGVPDECDVASGAAADCNGNLEPDECEVDDLYAIASATLSPFGGTQPQSLTLPAPPPAAGEVMVYLTAHADLDLSFELVNVRLNGTTLGVAFQAGAFDCSASIEQMSVPAATFNAALAPGADAVLTLAPNGAVDAGACGGNTSIMATLWYTFVPPNDRDGDGIPDDCEKPGDLDGSGHVDGTDLSMLLAAWGMCATPTCPEDLDGSGRVGFADLVVLLRNWG